MEIGRGAMATPVEGFQYAELLPNATGGALVMGHEGPGAAGTGKEAFAMVNTPNTAGMIASDQR
jgi:hypothetical protein